MKKPVLPILAAALIISGCSGMSYTEQRVLSGGAAGATGGALIGAAAGGGAGLLGGYV